MNRFQSIRLQDNQQRLNRASANAVFRKIKHYMPNLARNVYLEDSTSKRCPFRFCHRVLLNGRRTYICSVQSQMRAHFKRFRLMSRLEKFRTIVYTLLLLKPALYNSRDTALELIDLMSYLEMW
ncbi:hypothetical protein ABPG72_020105 [Tetrahymena utriculariae]